MLGGASALTVALVASLAATASASTILHVDAAALTDSGNCQSSPCKKIGTAIAQSQSVSGPVTIQVAAGTYTENLALGSADSGLTITGAGSGTSPGTNTVITGISGNPTINTASAGAAASLSISHVRIVNLQADASAAISSGATDLSLNDVAVDVQGTPSSAVAFGGNTTMTGGSVTVENSAASTTAVTLDGRRSSLSHVSIGGAWSGAAINSTGSLDISDSSIMSGSSPTSTLLSFADGGLPFGSDVSIVRSTITQRSTSISAIEASAVNVVVDSTEVLGGNPAIALLVTGGPSLGRVLTLASSTVDAGTLGSRDASPTKSVLASTDGTADNAAIINAEGSILVEAPAATTGDATVATAAVNCFQSEVPDTTQAAGGGNGAINCATGTNGDTFTSALSSIFANPASGYALNPSWNGLDSVPEAAIVLPFPFSDSSTDLLGNPRVVNGIGTCQPGIRDKGAIELTGHAGVTPVPAITSPANVLPGVAATFTGSAPNIPASVPLSFSWHSSDGASATGAAFTHTFARPGSYTVSVTVTGAAACIASKSAPVSVHGIDNITALTVSPRVFRAAGSGPSVVAVGRQRDGTNVSYQGTEAATTSFTVQLVKIGRLRGRTCRQVAGKHPKGKRCTLYLSVGAFNHTDAPGSVAFHFTGRLLGRKLPPANYRLRAIASDPVGKGQPVYGTFTIKK